MKITKLTVMRLGLLLTCLSFTTTLAPTVLVLISHQAAAITGRVPAINRAARLTLRSQKLTRVARSSRWKPEPTIRRRFRSRLPSPPRQVQTFRSA